MNKFFILFAIVGIVIFSSCKRQKITKSAEDDSLSKLAVKEIDYKYFTSKARVNYNDGSSSMGFTVNIRMQKDSVIWFSASPALGIEAARAMITPDSVRILNRLNNTYQAYNIDYLKKTFNVNLSFSNLQNMLMGNLVVPKAKGDKVNEAEIPACVILLQEKETINLSNYINTESHKVTKLRINETGTMNNLTVDYSDFKELGEFIFPYENIINASVQGKEKNQNIEIKIQHNKAEISNEPLNFAFNVPSKFESR